MTVLEVARKYQELYKSNSFLKLKSTVELHNRKCNGLNITDSEIAFLGAMRLKEYYDYIKADIKRYPEVSKYVYERKYISFSALDKLGRIFNLSPKECYSVFDILIHTTCITKKGDNYSFRKNIVVSDSDINRYNKIFNKVKYY